MKAQVRGRTLRLLLEVPFRNVSMTDQTWSDDYLRAVDEADIIEAAFEAFLITRDAGELVRVISQAASTIEARRADVSAKRAAAGTMGGVLSGLSRRRRKRRSP